MKTAATSAAVIANPGDIDRISASWLVSGRWLSAAAAIATVVIALRSPDTSPASLQGAFVVFAIAATNILLWWRNRSGRGIAVRLAALFLCADVLLLSWLLSVSGGPLNAMAVFGLVEIVLAALVLGRIWAWTVAAVAIIGYGVLFARPSADLEAAQIMHPAIAMHMQGMWVAFAATALVIAFLVTRLVVAIEVRDRDLAVFQDRAARQSKVESLTTAVAGAAHELSSPLATIAVAARDLEIDLTTRANTADLVDDAQLIRAQIARCRTILDQMGSTIAGARAAAPEPTNVDAIVRATLSRLSEDEATRVTVTGESTGVMWPRSVVELSLLQIVRNALQASPTSPVGVNVAAHDERITLVVSDHGSGMTADVLSRAGEPFFTTKPTGDGMGLGLFVARSSIEQLRGNVRIDSTAGQGTTVTIDLPRNVAMAS